MDASNVFEESYSTKGIEQELAVFLDTKDLEIRSSKPLTKKLNDIVLASHHVEMLKQHGCDIEDNALIVNIDKKLGFKLLAASESVPEINLKENTKNVCSILVQIPVLFTFAKK